jgi:hypothetical protein
MESMEEKQIFNKLNYNKGNYESMKKELKLDWGKMFSQLDGDVVAMWDLFKDRIQSTIERFIPVQNYFYKWKKHHWTQPLKLEIRQLIHKKHRLWTKYIKTRKENTLKDYREIRNKVRAATRRSKVKEQEFVAKHCKENPKMFWSYVNSKRKISSKIGDIKAVDHKGKYQKITSDADKAEAFNEYFSSVYSIEGQEEFEPMIEKKTAQGEDIKFDEVDILHRLAKLNVNKAAGVDGIHPRVLYELRNTIALPLKLLFECSFKNKKLPEDWRSADVAPIFKKRQ